MSKLSEPSNCVSLAEKVIDEVQNLVQEEGMKVKKVEILRNQSIVWDSHSIPIYRAVSDRFCGDVSLKGFRYPPHTTQYAAGKGGLYFAVTVKDVIIHCGNKDQKAVNFYAAISPSKYEKCGWRRQAMVEPTKSDSLCTEIRYGRRLVSEFIKAGVPGEHYVPDLLLRFWIS